MTQANILLVDDETSFLETVAKRLKKRGLEVSTAESGQQGLDALAADQHIEVVILDVKMPGMDGIETLKRMRADHPLVEVIMLTGHATVESAIEGMKAGAFDYLMKPCDIEILMQKVADAATRKRAQEEKILQARIREITERRE